MKKSEASQGQRQTLEQILTWVAEVEEALELQRLKIRHAIINHQQVPP